MLFLTREGKPFIKSDNVSPPTGVYNDLARIRQCVQRSHPEFHFKYHDLRATYGMRILDAVMSYSKEYPDFFHSEFDYLRIVSACMGHSNIATTLTYLLFRKRRKILFDVQAEHERWIDELIRHVDGR